MTEIVTGDAVVVDLRPVQVPTRILAFLIDAVLQLGGLALLIWAGSGLPIEDTAAAAAASTAAGLLALLVVPVTVETLSRGRSVGKLVLGLRVVRDDGGAIRFRHALTRGLLGLFVDLWLTLGVVATIASLLSARGKRLGDHAAGTVVVRERIPGRRLQALPEMDPRLVPWAASLDLSQLPGDLVLAVRQFLLRAPKMAAEARLRMGQTLAHDVAQRVQPWPPQGVPAEAYLVAVLAERRHREAARTSPPPADPYRAQAWASPSENHPGSAQPPSSRPPSSGGFSTPG